MKNTYLMFGVLIVAIVAVLFYVRSDKTTEASPYDEFAQCLTDSGAKFYGAFWCPHCNDQKALFGSAVKHLPYIECSSPDGEQQLQKCIDANITGYPTWEFATGERQTGLVPLEELALKTNCSLPAVTQ